MRITDDEIKAVLICCPGDCPQGCPYWREDICHWVSEGPDKDHKNMARDLLEAREIIREMRELISGVVRVTRSNLLCELSNARVRELSAVVEKSKEYAQ